MLFADPLTAIQTASNARAVTYTDERSAKGSSYDDMCIGYEKHLVGCNTKIFGPKHTMKGDLVLIKANKGKQIFMNIGILEKRLSSCTAWKDEGGEEWEHNWEYTPLTTIFELTPMMKETLERIGKETGCNAKNFTNPRFHSILLRPMYKALFETSLVPLVT